ncbi:hypothetical protein DD630_25870 [Streptomyces sp. BSE7F]|nr:hypothetical protein DD630_25870 [Streptomyces sp. BSE7F]
MSVSRGADRSRRASVKTWGIFSAYSLALRSALLTTGTLSDHPGRRGRRPRPLHQPRPVGRAGQTGTTPAWSGCSSHRRVHARRERHASVTTNGI